MLGVVDMSRGVKYFGSTSVGFSGVLLVLRGFRSLDRIMELLGECHSGDVGSRWKGIGGKDQRQCSGLSLRFRNDCCLLPYSMYL